jgi:two-component sensor histidine kinase
VHEILSRDTTDEVDFNDILPSLARMAEDMGSSDRPVRIGARGEAGMLPATLATPLAVVLNELLQNAAEHARPVEGASGYETGGTGTLHVDVELERLSDGLRVRVRDDGVGLPEGFSIEKTTSLGLSIVLGLVRTQLGGTISMRTDGGTVVDMVVPVDHRSEDLDEL